MKKHTRIGLMVLVTLILLLALTIPGLAKKPETYSCNITVILVSSGGYTDTTHEIGELEAYWDDGILYNFCTATIPLGEPHDKYLGWRYATFDEVCEFWGEFVTCEKNVISTDIDQWMTKEQVIFNPDTGENIEYATYFYAELHKNGKSLFYKEYNPPE